MAEKPVFIMIFVFHILCAPVSAQEVEIGDLIMNRAMTRVGHEFYRAFSDKWVRPPNTAPHNISIKEKASARWGSILSVYVDDQYVWGKILGIRTSDMNETVQAALKQCQTYILKETMMEQTSINDDMASDGY